MSQTLYSFVCMCLLAAIQVLYPRWESAMRGHGRVWIPFSGGMAVGYVFLVMLPKLSDFRERYKGSVPNDWEILDEGVYLICLLGMLSYLVIDRYRFSGESAERKLSLLHSASFVLYSFLLGDLIADVLRPGLLPHVGATLALGGHLLGICHQLRAWHPADFDRYVRWLLAAAMGVGWAVGAATVLPAQAKVVLTAFVSGVILVNVMREEVPAGETGRLWALLSGVAVFLILVLLVACAPQGQL